MVVAITGASQGLGLALAGALSNARHRVHTCSRSALGISNASRSMSHVALDVLDQTAVNHWIEGIWAAEGRIDVVVNNAAVMNHPAPLWQIDKSDFDLTIDININGVMNVIRACTPKLIIQGHGSIVNLISGSAKQNPIHSGAYNASKAAVESLSCTLAKELPHGICVVSLIPGTTNTEMSQKILGERAEKFPDAHDWASRALPLITTLHSSQSGQTLTVPGTATE